MISFSAQNDTFPLKTVNYFFMYLFIGWNCWQHIEGGKADEKTLSTATTAVAWKAKGKG